MGNRIPAAVGTRRTLATVDVAPREVLLTHAGVSVYHGGYGSALAPDPRAPGYFYLLTDRGPNFDVPDPAKKAFAVPTFRPHIGRFARRGEVLVRVATIPFTGEDGAPLTGLPHPPSEGGTGEIPIALDGNVLPFDAAGIDPEGLAALADGSFWISDEYGPSLIHVSPEGRVLERVSPHAGTRRLPRVFARRWPNRGLEAVAMLPDGRTLATIAQSALDNPAPGTGATSATVRLLLFDTTTGTTRQYLYLQEAPGLSNSALAALAPTTLLTIEHDRRFTHDRLAPSIIKRIYAVDLAGATDVSDPAGTPHGLLAGGRTLETLSADELLAAGIRPARKTLLSDLVALGYPHDKPEGLAVVGDTLAVLNDDDFGIDSDGAGGIQPKMLPGTDTVNRNLVTFIPFDAAFRTA